MSSGGDYIEGYLDRVRSCLNEISEQDIAGIVDIIFQAWRDNKCVFIIGNGGSATTAAHFARDLNIGTATAGKKRLKALSLADNIATVTALANDVGYQHIFTKQLMGSLDAGDVVIGISASGNSPNLLEGIEYARSQGVVTAGFLGFGGGRMKGLVDRAIVLSCKEYGPVEDAHLILEHIICALVKERIAGD